MKRVWLLFALLSTPASSQVDKQDLAYKLVGYMSFVESSCSGMSVDHAMLRLAVDSLGFNMEKAMARAKSKKGTAELGLMMEFKRDMRGNCKLMEKWFGPDGETIPGLIDLD